MKYSENTVIKNIKSNYDYLTNVEKNIADFFLNNKLDSGVSTKIVSEKLFVSEASLSRFAKKLGYKGFREFAFEYKKNISKYNSEDTSNLVINTYQDILDSIHLNLDKEQLKKVANMLIGCKRLFIFGMGSSGIVATELKLRFMRFGIHVDAVSDLHRIKMLATISDEATVILAISLSGTTTEVLQGMTLAKSNKANVVFITSNTNQTITNYSDEIIKIPVISNLDDGNLISPQFPVLVVADIIYAYFLNIEEYYANNVSTIQNIKTHKYINGI